MGPRCLQHRAARFRPCFASTLTPHTTQHRARADRFRSCILKPRQRQGGPVAVMLAVPSKEGLVGASTHHGGSHHSGSGGAGGGGAQPYQSVTTSATRRDRSASNTGGGGGGESGGDGSGSGRNGGASSDSYPNEDDITPWCGVNTVYFQLCSVLTRSRGRRAGKRWRRRISAARNPKRHQTPPRTRIRIRIRNLSAPVSASAPPCPQAVRLPGDRLRGRTPGRLPNPRVCEPEKQ